MKKLLLPCANSGNTLLATFKLLKLQKNCLGIFLFYEALEVGKPVMTTKKIRRGKQMYDVPNPITPQGAYDISMKQLVNLVKKYPVKTNLGKKFFLLCCDFLNSSVQIAGPKIDLHRLVTVNRAYLHYR